MKKLNIITTLFLLFTVVTSYGQEIFQKSYIEVTGASKREIIPDEIYIAITIRERYDGKKKITIEQQEKNFRDALKIINIPLNNFVLSDANSDYIRIRWRKQGVIVNNDYVLKVNDASSVKKVFKKLDQLKILGAYISKVDHSNIVTYRKEVRIEAIKAAKEKADYLLSAIDEQTGKPLKIHEEVAFKNNKFLTNQVNNKFNYSFTELEEVNEAIQFQKIKLQSSIYVKFEIK